jgi:hypothetical protein
MEMKRRMANPTFTKSEIVGYLLNLFAVKKMGGEDREAWLLLAASRLIQNGDASLIRNEDSGKPVK